MRRTSVPVNSSNAVDAVQSIVVEPKRQSLRGAVLPLQTESSFPALLVVDESNPGNTDVVGIDADNDKDADAEEVVTICSYGPSKYSSTVAGQWLMELALKNVL